MVKQLLRLLAVGVLALVLFLSTTWPPAHRHRRRLDHDAAAKAAGCDTVDACFLSSTAGIDMTPHCIATRRRCVAYMGQTAAGSPLSKFEKIESWYVPGCEGKGPGTKIYDTAVCARRCEEAFASSGGCASFEPVAAPRNTWLQRKRCVCTATAWILTVAESSANF